MINVKLKQSINNVTPDLCGCPRGKNLYVCHFKGKYGNLYIIGKLNKCRFWKKWGIFFQPIRSTTNIWVVHVISMEFLRLLLRRCFVRDQVTTLQNVGCFLRLWLL